MSTISSQRLTATSKSTAKFPATLSAERESRAPFTVRNTAQVRSSSTSQSTPASTEDLTVLFTDTTKTPIRSTGKTIPPIPNSCTSFFPGSTAPHRRSTFISRSMKCAKAHSATWASNILHGRTDPDSTSSRRHGILSASRRAEPRLFKRRPAPSADSFSLRSSTPASSDCFSRTAKRKSAIPPT